LSTYNDTSSVNNDYMYVGPVDMDITTNIPAYEGTTTNNYFSNESFVPNLTSASSSLTTIP